MIPVVMISRSARTNYELRGHPLILLTLKYSGIMYSTAKSFGNRNTHDVVGSTFKAVATHESTEDIAVT